MLEILREGAQRYGVKLSEAQCAQFETYLKLLQEWSERANLVGNADAGVVQRRHFVESLALGAALREREILRPETRIIDVGAGAGFPGIPMKIAWPSVNLTLLEATAKKTAFLSDLAGQLRLEHTDILTGRAEDLAHEPALREQFDLVLARALAPLPTLLELTLPFAKPGGRVVTVKGSRLQQELADSHHALSTLGARPFTLPLDVEGPPQTIVAILKQRPTPEIYPRRPGVPARSPL